MQKDVNVCSVPLAKEEFVDIINRLRESSELVDKVDDLFRKSRDNIECDFCNGAGLQISHEGIVVNLLEKLMQDKDENISYFIYELDYGRDYQEGCISDNNVNIDIGTAEKLYDYLIVNYFMEKETAVNHEEETDKDIEHLKYVAEIRAIGESMKSLSEQAFLVYKPLVDDICARKDVCQRELECFLDYLVSVCISDEMVGLFKRVGRQFYYQYPQVITDYVELYKELYGDEEE